MPSPTTERPMTAPDENAILKPLPKLFFTPSAALALDLVAMRMPMFPARAENMAPTRNDMDASHGMSV